MALRRPSRAAALVLLAFAASAAAARQPATSPQPDPAAPPPPAEQPTGEIVVTGALPLVVDVEQVARRCAACQRAIARMQAVAVPPSRRRSGPQAIDPESRASPNLGFGRPADPTGILARGAIAYSETQTRARITSRRSLERPQVQVDVQALADRYLQNLMTYVGPIVDREIQERRAPAAYAAGDPQARGTAVTDITDAVIQILDRDHGDADLLAGPRPS